MLIVWPGVIKRQATGGSLLLVTPTAGERGDPGTPWLVNIWGHPRKIEAGQLEPLAQMFN